jgi:DNA-binding MarR family transcriptional regulator
MIAEKKTRAGQRRAPNLAEQVAVDVARASNRLMVKPNKLIKARGISPLHYNVLRILRGAGSDGLACSAIADRLINRTPDITRLVDRLEAKALVERRRDTVDRRVALITLTDAGAELLAELDEPIATAHEEALAGLSEAELEQMRGLLQKILRSA